MQIKKIAQGSVAVSVLAGLLAMAGCSSGPLELNDSPAPNDVKALPPDDPCYATARVNTPDELESTLRSQFTGCVVIPRDKFFDMTGRSGLPLRSGVSLFGERGDLGSRPSLFTDSKAETYSLFEITGNDVRVAGLHFRGPAHGSRSSDQVYTNAIQILADPDLKLGRRVVVADNEFDEWTGSGVDVRSTRRVRVPSEYLDGWARLSRQDAGLVRIEKNYMHHNARDGGGYGVTVGGGAYATIEGNVFDYNRHAVASDGFAHSGYIARFNYVLEGGFKQDRFYNQHFDVHGTNDTNGDGTSTGYGGSAGEFYEIAYNTIRGDQGYYCFIFCLKTRPAFMLRGAPTTGAYFHDNVAIHEDLDEAVSLKWEKGDSGSGEDQNAFHFHASGNQFDTDRSGELATGDFDGDGRTDVFIATGTAWFFSRAGSEPWEFLHASNKRTKELGFADIDNDGVTDVLYRDGSGNVGYLRNGVEALVALTTSPVSMKDMRFGDFDGDGRTDIFYTRDEQWTIWYGRTRAWTATQTSRLPISELLFGEFDTVRGTDVAGVTNGTWAYSSAATGSWQKLNDRLRASFARAVVADFDGDGKSDIAFEDGGLTWSYSPSGRLPMRTLRDFTGAPGYGEFKSMLVGHFDSGPRAQVVSFYDDYSASSDPLKNHFVIWRGGARSQFSKLSWQAMR